MDEVKSFLRETMNVLREINKAPSDIKLVANTRKKIYCSFEEFQLMASKLNDGRGTGSYFDIGSEDLDDEGTVDIGLRVFFKDGSMMIRYEYDGSSKWVYLSACPNTTEDYKKIEKIFYLHEDMGEHHYRCYDTEHPSQY